MATGRIRRSARRGRRRGVLGWLGVAAFSCSWPRAPRRPDGHGDDQRPDAAGRARRRRRHGHLRQQDPGAEQGRVASAWSACSANAIVYTDVTVQLLRPGAALAPGQSAAWTFPHRRPPGRSPTPTASSPGRRRRGGRQQVVDPTLAALPPLPAPTPSSSRRSRRTCRPCRVNLPPLPQVNVPPAPGACCPTPGRRRRRSRGPARPRGPGRGRRAAGADPGGAGRATPTTPALGAPQMAPSDVAAASAFDPSRYFVPGPEPRRRRPRRRLRRLRRRGRQLRRRLRAGVRPARRARRRVAGRGGAPTRRPPGPRPRRRCPRRRWPPSSRSPR